MARKNLLAHLTGGELPAGNSPPSPAFAAADPAFASGLSRGAVGAVSRSIEQIRAHSVLDLAPDLIDASFIEDRLGASQEEIASLTDSMREHGQQVPILVRPHPDGGGRYQIAYGRRRLRAAAALGRTVRAVVKPLTDEQLVVAQGQENNERKDLSFIERALFAAELEARGFGRETIMAAMCVDKTGLSRLISSAVRIPPDVLRAIGPAPRTGRDRWAELALALDDEAALAKARAALAAPDFAQLASDERFGAALRAASVKAKRAPRATLVKSADGKTVAQIRSERDKLSLIVDRKRQGAFAAFLIEELPALYARFSKRAQA